jgi:hypothetical protein
MCHATMSASPAHLNNFDLTYNIPWRAQPLHCAFRYMFTLFPVSQIEIFVSFYTFLILLLRLYKTKK